MDKNQNPTYADSVKFFKTFAFPDRHMQNAIEALDKQIPRVPYDCKTSGGEKGHMCPGCHRLLTLGYPQHCEFCGQAIDWEV